jgi:hypothetical protein
LESVIFLVRSTGNKPRKHLLEGLWTNGGTYNKSHLLSLDVWMEWGLFEIYWVGLIISPP